MQRQHDGRRQRGDQLDERSQTPRVVDVACPVRREEQVLAATHAVLGRRALIRARGGLAAQRDVDHHVADDLHVAGDRLGAQVGCGRLGWAEQQRREVVGEHAVELLGHTTVERAHAGLDVNDRCGGLRRGERAGERRVGVAVNEHCVGGQLGDQRLERAEHARRLPGVRAAADAQLAIGPRQAQLGKEHARERVVVVLAGVTSTSSWRSRNGPDTAAALTNCGLLPTTVRIFTPAAYAFALY